MVPYGPDAGAGSADHAGRERASPALSLLAIAIAIVGAAASRHCSSPPSCCLPMSLSLFASVSQDGLLFATRRLTNGRHKLVLRPMPAASRPCSFRRKAVRPPGSSLWLYRLCLVLHRPAAIPVALNAHNPAALARANTGDPAASRHRSHLAFDPSRSRRLDPESALRHAAAHADSARPRALVLHRLRRAAPRACCFRRTATSWRSWRGTPTKHTGSIVEPSS